MLEIVGDSMGMHHDDHFKRLKMLQDADAIVADCQDLVAAARARPATHAARDPGDARRAAAAAARPAAGIT